MKRTFLILFIPLISLNCGNNLALEKGSTITEEFAKYWYSGKAEITSYKLQQARYGEMHAGSAVTIFVTEDFSAKKHVKLDNPQSAGSDAVSVLKLNLTKNFNTGIYPYSMMLSVFKPINTSKWEHALKITASSQEWCGHTFTQIDADKDKYNAKLFSYFESEGDQEKILPLVWMEDELWTLLRINPSGLPIGNIKIIPGLLQQRLLHTNLQAEDAGASLVNVSEIPSWIGAEKNLMSYSITYKEKQRTLRIYFSEGFPHAIAGWEESYPDGFGKDKKTLTTRAVKDKTIITDYWNHHHNSDAALRDSLDLK
ncbi:MAG: hypothetical protein H0V01_07745 [Bacteroidetes bacterium]|nr:hypothetical protein [Bacteroidota bacterium]HET6243159.1 hypothetical protein [Bacteroidia bacterium]